MGKIEKRSKIKRDPEDFFGASVNVCERRKEGGSDR